ncbi:AAA family ATPase [Leptolyngbya sp. FACHB-261]|uniref:nSTAND1 domain-containing NTPase n=1 Tax=Leptolyngbya sp. FACHB-261 TaxID=2692806 RepID=UPI0016822F73|nr:AAA family ATPase [Leptolyngbya sp. FACHB-261]MBD2100207.1 hypothetical protein [Leptolyngbya sp. FACHB-261]
MANSKGRETKATAKEIAQRNEQALATLARTISRLWGRRFSLILVRCNYACLRSQLIQQLQTILPAPIPEFVVPDSAKTLYTSLKAKFDQSQPPALMVSGLESVRALDDLLTSTNLVREEFRTNFKFPLVLWVDDQVLSKLARLATDFNNWGGVPLRFEWEPEELIHSLKQRVDELFVTVLNQSLGGIVDDLILRLGKGNDHRWELELALADLKSYGLTPEPSLEASLEFFLGRDDHAKDQVDSALDHYQNSLSFWQQSNDLERQGCLLLHLGLCWRLRAIQRQSKTDRDLQCARDYLQDCLEKFQQVQRLDLVARFIPALGEVLQKLNQWDDLEILAHKALALHRTYSDPLRLAFDYGLLSAVALDRKDWYKAKQNAEIALDTLASTKCSVAPKTQEPSLNWVKHYHRGLYLLLLAQAQKHLGQVQEARQNLEVARAESDLQYDPQYYLQILDELRQLYFAQKHYLEAFEIKREQRSIEQQYGLQAFVGAGRLQPQRQARSLLNQVKGQEIAPKEISALGRQQDVDRLIERISRDDCKLTVIHGPSGVGKSSVIEAGLIPALEQREVSIAAASPVLLRAYTDWVRALAKALGETLQYKGVTLDLVPESTIQILEQLRKNESRKLLIVLIFDQFEEFFFINQDQEARQTFFEFLGDCLNLLYVKVVLCLREDYLHHLLEFERFTELGIINNDVLSRSNRYYLGNFTPVDAEQVIKSLTERAGFRLEPVLIQTLVTDLAKELGEVRPIELQLVGVQLQVKDITTLARYQECGSKEELVKSYLAGVIEDCGPENQQAAELVLYLLTNERGTRPLKTRAELEADLPPVAEQLDLILKILVKSGLVFQVPGLSDDCYQLAHDYLVSLICQRQEAGLLYELSAIKEKQQFTEEQLNHTLKQLEQSLYQEQRQRKRAEAAELEVLCSLAQALLLSHDQLGALLSSIKAYKQLKETDVHSIIRAKVLDVLQQVVNEIQERNRLEAHTNWINNVKFSPTGQIVASASGDKTIKLWGLDGTLIRTLQGHDAGVFSVSFSPDGLTIASASLDKTIKLWGLDGTLIRTLQGHDAGVFSVSFSPDGLTIASASLDKTIKLWSLDGTLIRTLQGHTDGVSWAVFSPDGKTIASASADTTVRLWSLDGTLLRTIPAHELELMAVCFSPDGRTIVSASSDKTIKIWSLDGALLRTIQGHNAGIWGVSFSPDGQTIASASFDKTIKIWSLDGTLLHTLQGHTDGVSWAVFSPDGKTIASASGDKTIKLWSLNVDFLKTLQGHSAGVWSVGFSNDGQVLASSSFDKTVKLWSFNGVSLATLRGHGGWINSVSFSPDSKTIASASIDQTIRLWSRDGILLNTLRGHSDWVSSVSFSPDGQTIASASLDKTIKLWNCDGVLSQTLYGHEDRVRYVSFSPDSKAIVSCGDDKTIKLWNHDGSLLLTLQGHDDWVNSVSFSPDGQTIASASEDKTIRLWSCDGILLYKLQGHTARVSSVAFSPDGKIIASASSDKTVKLWGCDGKLLQTFKGHSSGVTSVTFSPDGRTLASASSDSTIILWNLGSWNSDIDALWCRGCSWLRDYLRTNPNVTLEDCQLCESIGT